MFFIISKEKAVSYIVAIMVVAIIFTAGTVFPPQNNNVLQTATSEQKLLPIYSVQTDEKKVSLTINCAWNQDDIDKILEVLKDNEIKVTFFMVGDWVLKFPQAVKKIYEAGHEIANHSYSHAHVNTLNLEDNKNQIKKCSDAIENIIGIKTNLYRGPYGEYNNTVIQAANEENHKTIQWSIDTLDYKGLSQEEMIKRINQKINNGSIILMHNGTENTASSLNGIIKNIKQQGYDIVTVSELIYSENFYIDNNGIQHKK